MKNQMFCWYVKYSVFLLMVFSLGNVCYSSLSEIKLEEADARSTQTAQNETMMARGTWVNQWLFWNRADDDLPAFGEFVSYDVPPKFIKKVSPKYPPRARLLGISGEVRVNVLVDKLGRVRDVRIYMDSGTGVGFEAASIKAARHSLFSPALRDGQPIAVWIIYSYQFILGK